MAVFRRARLRTMKDVSQILLPQTIERPGHRRVIVRDHRVAVILLVAGVDQRVERHRIVIGRGDLLLDQGAERAQFILVQRWVHYLLLVKTREEIAAQMEILERTESLRLPPPHSLALCGYPAIV